MTRVGGDHIFDVDVCSGAAKLTYCAFYDKSMKFGTVIPWTISISFGRGGNLAHA